MNNVVDMTDAEIEEQIAVGWPDGYREPEQGFESKVAV